MQEPSGDASPGDATPTASATPCRSSNSARLIFTRPGQSGDIVIQTIALFAAAQATVEKYLGEGDQPNTDPIFNTAPPPSCFKNCRTAARFEQNCEVRFNWIV